MVQECLAIYIFWNVPETAEEQKRAGRKKMKILSIAVPCYNSEAYMEKCIDSLLVGGEEVEILIVDDGSKDGTTEIADRYQEKYPTIVKAIHQENKGHGGAVNTGVENATGLYFKVVDSDDWVNPEAYQKILNVLAEVVRGPKTLDLLISNYVYEKEAPPHRSCRFQWRSTSGPYPQRPRPGNSDRRTSQRGHTSCCPPG